MKHDRVLNTRVSKKLYDKISSKAKKHRITISNLIRNLVEDTLEVNQDIHDAIDEVVEKHLSKDTEKVLGFQEITLVRPTACDSCGKNLKAQDKVFIAFPETGGKQLIFCPACKTKTTGHGSKKSNAVTSDN